MTTTPAVAPLSADEMDKQRNLFEAHFGPKDNFAWRFDDGKYKLQSLQSAWEVWQAALIAQARLAAQPVVAKDERVLFDPLSPGYIKPWQQRLFAPGNRNIQTAMEAEIAELRAALAAPVAAQADTTEPSAEVAAANAGKLPAWLAYDAANEAVSIFGINYAADLFREFAETLPIGQPFEIVKRESGMIAVNRLDRALATSAGDADTTASVSGEAATPADTERAKWTTKQWYEHVGAWETPEGFISFGSVMALGAMLMQFQRVHAAPVAAAAPVSQAVEQPADDAEDAQTQAVRDVLAERRRQVEAEGWTPAHDDGYTDGALARAAAAYTLNTVTEDGPHYWPWPRVWWKPIGARRDLVKAGALLLAEIERIDRAAMSATKQEDDK